MSNIGFSELLFILILAFIILGPERLPKAMYNLGLVLKKIKQQYQQIQQDFQKEINNVTSSRGPTAGSTRKDTDKMNSTD